MYVSSLKDSINYIDQTIEYTQKLATSSLSTRVQQVAKVSLLQLQENKVASQNRITFLEKQGEGTWAKFVSHISSWFFRPVIHSQAEVTTYQTKLQGEMLKALQEELSQDVQSRVKNSQDVLAQGFLRSLWEKSASCSFLTETKRMEIVAEAVHQNIPFTFPLFAIKVALSNIIFDPQQLSMSRPIPITIHGDLLTFDQKRAMQKFFHEKIKNNQTALEQNQNMEKEHQFLLRREVKELQQAETALFLQQQTQQVVITVSPLILQSMLGSFPQELLDLPKNKPLKDFLEHDIQAKRRFFEEECTQMILSPTRCLSLPLELRKKFIETYLQKACAQKTLSLQELVHMDNLLQFLLDVEPNHPLQHKVTHTIEHKLAALDIKKMLSSPKLSEDEVTILSILRGWGEWTATPRIRRVLDGYLIEIERTPERSAHRYAEMIDNEEPPPFLVETVRQGKVFAYKAKSLENKAGALRLAIKAEVAIEKISHRIPLQPEERLTLEELGHLEDMKNVYYQLKQWGAKEGTGRKKIEDLLAICGKAEKAYKRIEKQAQKECVERCPSGTIALVDAGKKSSMYKHVRCFEEQINALLISRFVHAAKVYIPKGGITPKVSHIFTNYENRDATLRDIALSEMYYLDPTKLLVEGLEKKLSPQIWQELYEGMRKEYQEIERHMNEDLKKNFASLTNNPGRRWQAGYAKFGLATSVIADVEKQCGFELLVKEMTEERLPSQDPNMICSEFAAKTTVAALVLLDSWLVNELQKKGVTVEHALEIPISPQRRFETIYPSELLTLFAKALKKIPSPPVLTSLLQGG